MNGLPSLVPMANGSFGLAVLHIRKGVQALDAKLALQRRHGSKIANAKYQSVGISPFSALAPLQLFQMSSDVCLGNYTVDKASEVC